MHRLPPLCPGMCKRHMRNFQFSRHWLVAWVDPSLLRKHATYYQFLYLISRMWPKIDETRYLIHMKVFLKRKRPYFLLISLPIIWKNGLSFVSTLLLVSQLGFIRSIPCTALQCWNQFNAFLKIKQKTQTRTDSYSKFYTFLMFRFQYKI